MSSDRPPGAADNGPMEIFDVVQIGYGPVGQMLAAHLGARGHRVAVLERHHSLYHLSRAGRIDHEVMRMLQAVNVADSLIPYVQPLLGINLVDENLDLLVSITAARDGVSGWREHYNMYQPDFERALDKRVRSLPTVTVERSWSAVRLEHCDDHVAVTLARTGSDDPGDQRVIRGRYVVGADGANSAVRRHCAIAMEDLGYEAPWLVCDFEHHDPDADLGWTNANQILDPKRPVTAARWLGRRHSRLEFMLLPGEKPETMEDEAVVWRLARHLGLTPDACTLVRHAVYTFKSQLAGSWRTGRVLLAGDAAHLMPPFMGQGLCSGLQDAVNLAWKLDLVLSGRASEVLLDHYPRERRPHVETVIRRSISMGAVIDVLDEQAAHARNEAIRQAGPPPLPEMPGIVDGVLHRETDGALGPGVGRLALQARVAWGGTIGRLDDLVGAGWQVLTRRPVDARALSPAQQATLDTLCAVTTHITPAEIPGTMRDIDFDYDIWFRSLGGEVVIVRPDFYVFAVLASVHDLGPALDDLAGQLTLR